MNQTLWVMVTATIATAILMVAGLGIGQASAQTADNATTGSTTGGNMTSGTTTEEIGGISSTECDHIGSFKCPLPDLTEDQLKPPGEPKDEDE